LTSKKLTVADILSADHSMSSYSPWFDGEHARSY